MRIITNSVGLVAQLEARGKMHPQLEIYVTGGVLYPRSGLLLGPRTEASISEYHAHWAFLSAGGMTERGSFNTNELVVGTERAMIRSAGEGGHPGRSQQDRKAGIVCRRRHR